MADRRRRKCPINDSSDVGSDDSGDEQQIQSVSNHGSDGGNSEYESVDEEELGEDEDEEEDGGVEGVGEGGVLNPDERAAEDKILDHDEDRKNPQYIPKKGTFYEHDDRTMGEDEGPPDNVSEKSSTAPSQEKEATSKKKVWKEDGKWQHDRFSVYDQSPKSREELVATYGYDIRNEEGPPRARRRRRYGRGPNKYTRNWEDMDAYSKPTRGRVNGRGGKGRVKRKSISKSSEDFPALPHKGPQDGRPNIDENEVIDQPPPVQVVQGDSFKTAAPNPVVVNNMYESSGKQMKNQLNDGHQAFHESKRLVEDKKRKESLGRGREIRGPARKLRGLSKGYQRNGKYSDETHFHGRSRGDTTRRRGDSMRAPGRGGHNQAPTTHATSLYHQKEVQDLTEELKSVTITPTHKEDHQFKNKRSVDNRRNTIPPRLQDSLRGSKGSNHGVDSNSVSKPKRYSSQRQRQVQEQMGPYHPNQGYFEQSSSEPSYGGKMYERSNSSPGAVTHSQLSLSGQAPPSFVAPSFTTSAPTFPPAPPRLFPAVTQPHLMGPPAVAGPPIGGAGGPPQVGGPGVTGPPVPGSVGGPPVTGPPFLPPENMINYAAGAPGLVATPHPPQFPAFQAFTPVSQQQPQEIYSNGVMYYNTQSQQHLPRINPVLQKRPKAAIPIVPPPDPQSYRDENEYEIAREAYEISDDNIEHEYIEESSLDSNPGVVVETSPVHIENDHKEVMVERDVCENTQEESEENGAVNDKREDTPYTEVEKPDDLNENSLSNAVKVICLEETHQEEENKKSEPPTDNNSTTDDNSVSEKREENVKTEAKEEKLKTEKEEDDLKTESCSDLAVNGELENKPNPTHDQSLEELKEDKQLPEEETKPSTDSEPREAVSVASTSNEIKSPIEAS